MDIVGFSVLPMKDQFEAVSKLQETVQKTDSYVAARENDGEFQPIPTGDGMALVFFRDPEAAVRCAVEVSHSLQRLQQVKVRMGIHVGPVIPHSDINANRNVVGGGINYAQRVMDQGDAGHMLVSRSMVDLLEQIGGWSEYLKYLGQAEVKHGEQIPVYLLYGADFGNSEVPTRMARSGFKNSWRRPPVPFLTIPVRGSSSRKSRSNVEDPWSPDSQPFSTSPSPHRLAPPVSHSKGWYHLLAPDGREYFLAFVNAKGSCSMRVFDGGSGRFLRKQYDRGDFQDAFSKYFENGVQVYVSRQPNLERECKDRLPGDVFSELRSQAASKAQE